MASTRTGTSITARPGVVTFIAVIMYIQSAIAVIAAVSLVIWRNDILDWLEQEGSPLSSGGLTGTIIAEFVIAVVLLLAAAGLMRGSNGWRLVIAIAEGLTMGVAVYTLISHHVGGYVYRSVFTLFVGVFVLWALYGNEQSERYFDENG